MGRAYPIVLVNSAAPTDRRRLTLAHELGHLVLHSHYLDADAEAEASAFAAEFLKAEWGVSMQALYERAYQLGMATSSDRSVFYRALLNGARDETLHRLFPAPGRRLQAVR